MGYLLTNPSGNIFGRRITRKHIVQVLMVKLPFYHFLYMRKINYHTIFIQLLCLAIYGDNPIVTMQVFTLALIRKFPGDVKPKFPCV